MITESALSHRRCPDRTEGALTRPYQLRPVHQDPASATSTGQCTEVTWTNGRGLMSRQRLSSGRAGLTALVTLISVGLSGCASPAAPTPSLASSAVSARTGNGDDGSSGRSAAGSTTAPLAPPSGTGTGTGVSGSAPVAPALAGAGAADLEQATADVSRLSLPRLAAQIVKVPRQAGSGATAAQPVRSQGYGGVAVLSRPTSLPPRPPSPPPCAPRTRPSRRRCVSLGETGQRSSRLTKRAVRWPGSVRH